MPDTKEKERAASVYGFLMLVMFLFGGTVGYIARDVRADQQIRQAASDARQDVQQATLETFQRLERAGQALVRGVAVTAESTKSAVTEPAEAKSDPAVRTQAKTATPKKPQPR